MCSTQRLTTNELDRGAELLKLGGVVAFPTETVYGLGACAFHPDAIAKIFQAKGRPSDNPLIVHIASTSQLNLLVENVSEVAKILMEAYWPGPLTLVMKKRPEVPSILTAGLSTVAIRMPEHQVALELIQRADSPLVAPSANRSGLPSATTWQAVIDDLDGRIDAVVCGEPTRLGIESTVVDVTDEIPVVLRHGSITQESIEATISARFGSNNSHASAEAHRVATQQVAAEPIDIHAAEVAALDARMKRSPGTRHRHYQPRAKVILLPLEMQPAKSQPPDSEPLRTAWIGLETSDGIEANVTSIHSYELTRACPSIEAYAASLYSFFRECDANRIDRIYCQSVPNEGLGRALMDRLSRAAAS